MQDLFAWDFRRDTQPELPETAEIIAQLDKIDQAITAAAPTWPIDKINRIDLSILRLSVFELLSKDGAPVKVIVDEAVELAKEYGSASSGSFVNGALGSFVTQHKLA